MSKFKNKYRNESARAQFWDYSWAGAYFVTITTANLECFFGEVIEGKMALNSIGQIAVDEWLKTPSIRPDMNLELGEFVVMPNHFHGIIEIGHNEFNKKSSLKTNEEVLLSKKLSPQSKNLSSIIRGYKSSVTIKARNTIRKFKWQKRFHDRIIRSHDEYLRISEYIRKNPANWNNDRNYKLP